MKMIPLLSIRLTMAAVALIVFCTTHSARAESLQIKPKAQGKVTREQASVFAKLALKGIHKEYPNKPADVLNSDKDIKSPKVMHPAFYGCFDWH